MDKDNIPTLDVFDPTCLNEKTIEDSLRNNFNDNNNQILVHPYNELKQCVYNGKISKIYWEKLLSAYDPSAFLNDSDFSGIEDRILDTIKNKFAEHLNIRDKKIIIQPLPEGQEIIQCSVDNENLSSSPPVIFVISKIFNYLYFDLVGFPSDSKKEMKIDDSSSPWYFDYKGEPNAVFKHSGDLRRSMYLLQHMSINRNNTDDTPSLGCFLAHAYRKKTFMDMSKSDPNICIVDFSKDSDVVKIYIIHFPLTRDFVKNSSICHICKYKYIPKEKKIIWTIPQQPEFVDKKFDVGEPFKCYKNGLKRFMKKVEMIDDLNQNQRKASRMTMTKKSDAINTSDKSNRNDENDANCNNDIDDDDDDDDDDDNLSPIIIQKPLLNSKICKCILEKFQTKKIFTFHRNIDKVKNLPIEKDEMNENNFNYTLPIAGGSIISGKSTVKLGRPIPSKKIASEFQNILDNREKNRPRPIVVLADKSSSANIPYVKTKLNAVYLLINLDEYGQEKSVNEILNNINAALPTAMQGSLSTIFVYLPSRNAYFYYRGIIQNSRKVIKFGDIVEFSDILSEASFKLSSPLVVPSQCSKWVIYNPNGSKLFNVLDDYNGNGNNNLNLVINQILDVLNNSDNNDTGTSENLKDKIKLQLRYIMAQMEVNLCAKDFEEMIYIISEKIQSAKIISKEQCLRLIINNKNFFDKWNTQLRKKDFEKHLVEINKENNSNSNWYSKTWLMGLVVDITRFDIENKGKYKFLDKYGKVVNDMIEIVNSYKFLANMYATCLLEILNTSVSMKSAYGIRKKGINQIVRNKKIKKNVNFVQEMTCDEMDNYLEENCTDDGVIILAINTNKIELMLEKCHNNVTSTITNNHQHLLKNLTTRYERLDRASKEMASCYITEGNQFNFYCDTNSQNLPSSNMLIIPILKEARDAMKNPHLYGWEDIKDQGSIDVSRIILRNTIYKLIPKETQRRYNIDSPGSPIIGEMLINILFSAIHNMAGTLKDVSKNIKEDGIITIFNGLMGLILSIMASGTVPLSLVYQTVLYKNVVANCKINLAKYQEKLWLDEMLNVWKFLKLENVISLNDVRHNAVNCIKNRLTGCYIASQSQSSQEKIDKYTLKKVELHNRAMWNYNILRPMVNSILKRKFSKIIDAVEENVHLPKRIKKGNEKLENGENEDITRTIDTKKEEKENENKAPQGWIEACQKIKILSLNEFLSNNEFLSGNERDKRLKSSGKHFCPIEIRREMHNILQDYLEITNETNISQNSYYQKLTNKHYLFIIMEKIYKIIQNNNINSITDYYIQDDKLSRYMDDMYSTSLDIYLKKSAFIVNEIYKLEKFYLKNQSWKECKEMEQKFLENFLQFKNPVYQYMKIPKIVELIISKNSQNCKDFKFYMENYIDNKLKYGNFMRGMISTNVNITNFVNPEHCKMKKIQQFINNNDEKIKNMIAFLHKCNCSDDLIVKDLLAIM